MTAYHTYTIDFTISIDEDLEEFTTVELEICLKLIYAGCAANISGPPENCYPAEDPEWELESLKSVIRSPSITLTAPAPVQVWAAINSNPLIFPDSKGVALLEPFVKGWEKGQIDASRLALGRAIVKFSKSKELEKTYEKYDWNLLIADVRRKEAYKPGDSKARRKRQKSFR